MGVPGETRSRVWWKRWKLQELIRDHNSCWAMGYREPPIIVSHNYVSDALLDTLYVLSLIFAYL